MATQISRRGFISAAAGFAGLGLVSGIPFPLAPKLPEIDLMQFCDGISSRYRLDAPFSQGGLTYATDGRIAVRTALIAAPPTDDEARLPNMPKLFLEPDPVWRPWPTQRFIQRGDNQSCCPFCRGRGLVGADVRDCPRCEGYGDEPNLVGVDQWDESTWVKHCVDCDGKGSIGGSICDFCAGSGSTDRPALQPVGDQVFAGHYDILVRSLQDVEWQPLRLVHAPAAESPVRFRFNGGEGLLMPVKCEAAHA